jgi:hypothetical protein
MLVRMRNTLPPTNATGVITKMSLLTDESSSGSQPFSGLDAQRYTINNTEGVEYLTL